MRIDPANATATLRQAVRSQPCGEVRHRTVRWQVFVCWGALAVLGAMLAVAAHATAVLPGDLGLTRELQEHRALDRVLAPLMFAVSVPGDFPVAEMIVGVVVGLAMLFRWWDAAVMLTLTTTGDFATLALKWTVGRPRPTADLVAVTQSVGGSSFPSGHVVHYVVFFGALSYLAWRSRRPLQPAARYLRAVLLFACGLLIVLVGPSRVYLGVHWPTDVIGGYLIGGFWLVGLIVGEDRFLGAARRLLRRSMWALPSPKR